MLSKQTDQRLQVTKDKNELGTNHRLRGWQGEEKKKKEKKETKNEWNG